METVTGEFLRILLVEDSEDDAELIRLALRNTRFELERVDRVTAAKERLAQMRFDVVLLDLTLPDSRGLDTFLHLKGNTRGAAVIVLTGIDDESLGLRTVQEGAQDYLVKNAARGALLARAIRYAFERKQAEAITERYAEELRKKNAELQDDLSLAREVQQAFLPQQYPAFPLGADANCGALCFDHRYYPAGAVGGDFFDVFPVSKREAGVIICDVMGHGVRAALVTAMLRALLGEHLPMASYPGDMLRQLNRKLRAALREVDSPLFVSAFYMVANAATGEVRYSNAGHPGPLRLRSSSVESLQLPIEGSGPALGLADAADYRTSRSILVSGDRLLLFTDGVYEVEGTDGEPFGLERFREAVRDRGGLPPSHFLDDLVREIRRFSATATFTDDACLLSLDFKASENP